MNNTAAVTIIGLGEMGRALADALIMAGGRTTVWNRSAAKADGLVARGAIRAATVEEAVLASPLSLVCLLDYDVADAILRPAAGALRGLTLVNLTNGTPDQARKAEGWARGHGAAYLDGGIMAIPSTVATSQAFVLYSGQKSHFEAHKETLEAIGAAKYLGADAGIAALYDLALLSAMNVMFDGFFHSVAMATSHDEGSAVGFTELLMPWLTNMAQVMPAFAADVDSDAEPVLVQGLDVVLASVRNMAQASHDAGVRADYFEHSAATLEKLPFSNALMRAGDPAILVAHRS